MYKVKKSGSNTRIFDEYSSVTILESDNVTRFTIEEIFVKDEYKGQGHEKLLIKEAIKRFNKDLGCSAKSKGIVAMLLQLGFVMCDRTHATPKDVLDTLRHNHSVFLAYNQAHSHSTYEDYCVVAKHINNLAEKIANDYNQKCHKLINIQDDMSVNSENVYPLTQNDPRYWERMIAVAYNTFGSRCEEYGYDANDYGVDY